MRRYFIVYTDILVKTARVHLSYLSQAHKSEKGSHYLWHYPPLEKERPQNLAGVEMKINVVQNSDDRDQ